MRNNQLLNKLFPILAIVLGIIAIVGGVHKLATKDLYDATAVATVVDIQEEWDNTDPEDSRLVTTVYIDYEVDGVRYEHVEAPESNGAMQIGDTMEILYQSQDPSKYSTTEIGKSAAIFIGVGVLVAAAGCFATFKAFKKG